MNFKIIYNNKGEFIKRELVNKLKNNIKEF